MEYHVKLDCGCKITAVYTVSVCVKHALELQDMKRRNDEAYRAMVESIRAGLGKEGGQ